MNVVTRGRLRHADLGVCDTERNDNKIWTISSNSRRDCDDDFEVDNAHQAKHAHEANGTKIKLPTGYRLEYLLSIYDRHLYFRTLTVSMLIHCDA